MKKGLKNENNIEWCIKCTLFMKIIYMFDAKIQQNGKYRLADIPEDAVEITRSFQPNWSDQDEKEVALEILKHIHDRPVLITINTKYRRHQGVFQIIVSSSNSIYYGIDKAIPLCCSTDNVTEGSPIFYDHFGFYIMKQIQGIIKAI